MKLRMHDLRLPLDHADSDILKLAARRLRLKEEDIKSWSLVRKAIDARRREIYFTYTIDLNIEPGDLNQDMEAGSGITIIKEKPELQLQPGSQDLVYSPVIVGSGPAGLFCALSLARQGYQPVVVEQGGDMDRRIKDVEQFWQGGRLNERSNIQFGEGGAGTFSDGKLTTRIDDDRVALVLNTFVEKGAPEEIRYLKKPHVGTDIIRQVVKKIRQEIISRGGEFYFHARMTDININKGLLKSIIINKTQELPCSILVLAVGNSARQVYRLLEQKNIRLRPKALAVGVRVEHPQELINKIQYGKYAGRPRLPAADYRLTYRDKATGRSAYSFCMCPGGYVVAAASGSGQLVTNGMSYYQRDSGIANSALVVAVNPADWQNRVLGGVKMQEELEQRAFMLGGSNYHAPAQLVTDFLTRKPTVSLKGSLASYKPGVTAANLWQLLPPEIAAVLQRGIIYWGQHMPGFISDGAVLTAVETRTSAPVRIERDGSGCSVSLPGLYPCGEGAGYAGGIVSSAVDGIKTAEKIISLYARPENQPLIKDDTIIKGSELKTT